MAVRVREAMILAAAVPLPLTTACADPLQHRLVAGMRATSPDAVSFTRTIVNEQTGSARTTRVERYDPRRPPAERWSLVNVDGHAPSADDIKSAAKSKRGPTPSYSRLAQWFGSPATRSDGAPGYVIYRFARLPAGVLQIGSHDASADTRAEVLVNMKGKAPFVERIHFTSDKGFRMMMVASVQSIDMAARYRPLPDGLVVPDGSSSVLTGSMLGKSGQIRTNVAFDAVEPVK